MSGDELRDTGSRERYADRMMIVTIYTIGYAGWAPAALRDVILDLGASTSKLPQ